MPDQAGAVGSTSATSPDEAKSLAIRGEGAVGSTVDVTVVVVSYNSRNWLERCLSPVVHQSGDVLGLEVIVVDNASTDGS
ncbi:MAG: glycosyltransferase, partial [Proteobacteria bacterium]|nr:glycosyltransferase [Pseudomonadota bacterium]